MKRALVLGLGLGLGLDLRLGLDERMTDIFESHFSGVGRRPSNRVGVRIRCRIRIRANLGFHATSYRMRVDYHSWACLWSFVRSILAR